MADLTDSDSRFVAEDLHVQATYRLTEALVAAENRMRRRVELLSEIVFETDANGALVFLNRAWTDTLGHSIERCLGRPLAGFVMKDDRPVVYARMKGGVPGRAAERPRIRVLRADGGIAWMELSAARLPDGGAVGALHDITERRTAEERLERMEREQARQAALFRTSLDNLTECVVIADSEGTPYYWNRAALALYGYGSMDEARRLLPDFDRSFELVLPDGKPVPREDWPLARAIRGEGVRDWECALRHRTARWERLFVHSATLARDDAGKPLLAVLSMVDVTARRQLEQQLRQSQKMEAIGQLASGIAHDLNNILTPILMGAEIMLEGQESEARREVLSMMNREARRGGAIIKQLLAFSRGWEGKRAVVEPGALVGEIMAIMKETFSRSIALSQHVEEGPWSVLVDRTQLHQVVLNLCVNARDAMPEGGRLSVGVFNILLKEDDPLLPQGAKPGPYVRIEVADTGRGIDPAIKDRIFDPFFTTKPMGQGTGLGLSTALGIVRSHGGFIKVDSTPGAGSVFNVFLPATEDAEQTPAPPAAGDPGTGRDHHILVVDDEAAVREMMRAALGLRGYRVTLAANGEEGLARFREHSGTISLVITDLMMPVMDGAALIEAVRRIDPRVPIVASSGLPELDRLGGIQASGVQAFLPKPFSVHALMQVVGKQLAA